jgi:hypothetical protein
VWDKGQRINQSDGELAWTSIGGALRIFDQNRVALLLDGAEHPTQKPVQLMKWCVLMTTGAVCDPYMGSGTTGVACACLGRPFVGVERHEPYFDIACRRIEQAQRQRDLFIETPVAEDPADQRIADLFAEIESACPASSASSSATPGPRRIAGGVGGVGGVRGVRGLG